MTERTPYEMIKDLWHWAFGNGRKGVEDRLTVLEDYRTEVATRGDVDMVEGCCDRKFDTLEVKIDKLTTVLNIHELIKLVTIVLAVVGAYFIGGQ